MDFDFTRHAVQLELQLSIAFAIRLGHVVQLHQEHLAFFDVDADFFARSHAEEVGRGVEEGQVAVLMIAFHVVAEYFRVDAVGGHVFFAGGDVFFFHFHLHFFEVHVYRLAFQVRSLAAEDDLLQFFRESAVRSAQFAVEEIHNGLREVQGVALRVDVFFGQMVLYHEEGHVAYHFGGRGDFDDIAKHHVHSCVHAAHFRPLVAKAHSGGLLAQVGVLSARHFMLVESGIGVRHLCIHAGIVGADALPIAIDGFQRFDVELRLARIVLQRVVHGSHGRLAGAAGEGAGSHVQDVYAGFHSLRIGVNAAAAAFVGVQVNRQIYRIFQRGNQSIRSFRFQEAGHIFDSDDVRAGILHLLSQVGVVLERIFLALRIHDVAGVAEASFGELFFFADFVDGDGHMVQLVQAVEDTEYIHAIVSGLVDEVAHHIFRIVGVADGVRATGQHLEEDIRCCFSHLAQSFPWAFVQETIRYVEGRAAPVFEGEELRHVDSGVVDGVHDVVGSHASSQEGLVRIAVSGIHEHDFLLVHDPLGEFFRSHFIEELAGASRCFFFVCIENRRSCEIRLVLVAGAGITIDGDFTDVGQELGAAVGNHIRFLQEPRISIDVIHITQAFLEIAGTQHVLQEINICLHAGNAEFIQAAEHLMDGFLRMERMGGDFNEQGIVVWSDDSAGVRGACIETDARAAAGAVRDDFAGVRHEIVLRVFGGDTALDSHAFVPDFILLTDCNFRSIQCVAFCDEDLALHDVHIGDHFGDGMFYLYTRVDFDEIEMLFILVYQEFYGAGIDVVHVLHQLHSGVADFFAELLRQGPSRSHFDDLLMTALDGAVTFEEVDHIAMFVAHDLHFDMLRVHDAFFYIHFIVAKSHLRFGACTVVRFFQVFHAVYISHAASAAAIDSLDHDRQAIGFSESFHFREIMDSAIGAGDHGDLGFLCLDAGIDLVTEHDEVFDLRSDEDDTFLFTAACQLRVFSQEAVARMDGIYVVLFTNTNDVFDVQVRIDRLIPFADQVRFIRTVAVKRQDIFFGINSHGTNAHFTAGTEYADRNLTAVCYQDFTNSSHEIHPHNKKE